MTTSFALISTACFIPERLFYNTSIYFYPKLNEHGAGSSMEGVKREETRIFISHGLGGIVGGGVTGYLFRRKPLQGILLLSPIMMCVAYGEVKLQGYKRERIKTLMMDQESNDKRQDDTFPLDKK
jgi:hypothetical protein